MKITKAGDSNPTYYLKDNTLVRVNTQGDFYVYTLSPASGVADASTWNAITAVKDKSGTCDNDGKFAACTESGGGGRMLNACVSTTFATLKITKHTDESVVTYTVETTGDNNDLTGYTVSALGDADATGICNNINIIT